MHLPKFLIILQVFWTFSLLFTNAEDKKKTNSTVTEVPKIESKTNASSQTVTRPINKNVFQTLNVDGSMIQRALYVLTGITVIGLLYFLVRAVRVKKTTTHRKKYGLLSNYEDSMEMAPLESDDEDTTVYEAKALRR